LWPNPSIERTVKRLRLLPAAHVERWAAENAPAVVTAMELPPLPPVALVVAQLRARGIELPAGPVRVDAYGDSPELSASLLALIREGRKRAGTSLLWAIEAENERLPRVGDIEVVVDHRNKPVLITRLVRVEVVPYNEVTAEYAAIEGEGDGSLEYWRKAHWAFFSRECRRIERVPSQTMPVVCSIFEVLHALSPAAA
jgi:uncharacterized protein YhfF